MKIKAKCLLCGCEFFIDYVDEGMGYFLGYDTDFYGDTIDDQRDPHEVVGYYCKRCGSYLRAQAEIERFTKVEEVEDAAK